MTVGLPWPRGAVTDDRQFRLVGPDGEQPLQTRVLDRWPDGSVRWCLFDFLATWDGVTTASGYRIDLADQPAAPQPSAEGDDPAVVAVSWGELTFGGEGDQLFSARVRYAPGRTCGVACDARLYIQAQGIVSRTQPTAFDVAEWGPVRRTHSFGYGVTDAVPESDTDGKRSHRVVGRLTVRGRVDVFPAAPVARVTVTVTNPLPAGHPGGNWDLGNAGSMFVRAFSWAVRTENWLATEAVVSPARGAPVETGLPVDLYQQSSGGANWASRNHIDRHRRVPFRRRGYTFTRGSTAGEGERAVPVVGAGDEGRFVGIAAATFWENFPKRVGAAASAVTLDLFPTEDGETHELQGGEQKTHTFSVALGRDSITDAPMVWCRSPIVCHAAPEWYAASGAVPYLTPKAADPHAAYLTLVDQALDGPDTFLHKREKIDEYGWRHFGDIYGDHEAVYHKGETPLISHYNNQYDCVAGFLVQFFRSGDVRWLSQGLECADHTCDIDVYHTDGDKAAYNRGLFWHTYHYADADTGTHRSYPKSITRGPVESLTQKMDALGETGKHLQKSYAVGGGPASSNNYNLGLMLAYYLTGNPLYRDGALELADFVISMDDPRRTPFRFLSREYTGLASESGGGGYHGPGRGPANSILASIVGHQLTGDPKYLAKAEQVLRRVVHPKQNLDRLDLLNAELRWFYTMTLQAVGRYLDYKIELDQLDETYAYARLSLLHYARWMAANERPILDTPERLQYPTETWAAQDMRKVEVFQYAAKHAAGAERERFLERAAWFFDYVPRKLNEFETKSLTRPVILMMRYGWSRNWWRQNPDAAAPPPSVPVTADDFGEWRMFVPQKAKAIKRAKRIIVIGGIVGLAAVVGLIGWLLR